MKIRNTIGCDPEFFLKKGEKIVSAVGLVPGSKHEPHPLKSGAGLQTDNVAIEFASKPVSNGLELVNHLRATFAEIINEYIPKEHTLFLAPSNNLDAAELNSFEAQQFGCSPSYDAWELCENPQPNATNSNLRSIGAHVHLGVIEGDGNDFLLDGMGKVYAVRALDCTLGLIDVLIDSSKEAVARRKLYGKCGEHRPTSYGVEYRSLGPWWMARPQTVMLVDAVAQDALKIVRDGLLEEVIEAVGGQEKLSSIINTGDYKQAKHLVETVVSKYLSVESKEYLEDCVSVGALRNLSKEWFEEVM